MIIPIGKYGKTAALLCMIFLGSCSPATQEIESFFRYLNDVRKELLSNQPEEKKQKLLTKARKRMLTLIDTEFVGRISLGNYYDQLNEKDQKEFIILFHQILAHNLVKRYIPIESITKEDSNVEFIFEEAITDPVLNTQAIVVHTKFFNNKIVYFIDFYLHLVGKKYKLYDVQVDGASVLQDYQNQFYSIINSKGYPYLIERLKEKYQKLGEN